MRSAGRPAEPRDDRGPRRGHAAGRAADRGAAAMRVLVVAVSARMLAQLAVADGYEVTALDRFGDVDLRAVAPGATAPTSDGLAALAADIDADAVVYGAGLENRPDLVRSARRRTRAAGDAPPSCWRRCATPGRSARRRGRPGRVPRRRGPAKPASTPCRPRRPHRSCRPTRPRGRGWLRKPRHGGGGHGVRRVEGRTCCARRRCCSAASTGCRARRSRSATAASAVVLGLTEQLHLPPGFRWTGNVTPPRAARSTARRARRPAARGLRRGRGALRRARRIRGRRGLGRPPGVGARGQPATVGLAGAVRPGQLRGPRPRRPRARSPRCRRPAGTELRRGSSWCCSRTAPSALPIPAGGRRAWCATSPGPARRSRAARPCARWCRPSADVPELVRRGARLLSALPEAVLVGG